MITLYMAITGFGAGFSFSVLSMAAIHNFDFQRRGSASSTNRFSITLFGIVQRSIFVDKIASQFANNNNITWNTRSLLSPRGCNQMSEEALQKGVDALSTSIALTFLAALVPAVLAVISIVLQTGALLE
ncbi:hypothetical protein SAMN04488072_11774 [Lentibacillus halodurans]|uniref:Uncharacterized protein n=1 Tax=Lentibacillus halodurans TaxID=237679 RepID=A0A1I1A952_9BACI|nr:hypothetical protein SAMN04488072_11774 [Lentibacillus halodurans]